MREVKNRIPFSEIVKAGNPSYTFRMVVDESKCSGCGQCAVECPSRIIEMVKKETDYQTAYCREACFASNDVRYAMKLVRDGKGYEAAFDYITRINPMPASIGRTCPHPCETECSRGHLDTAVNLHGFERFVGDYAIEKGLKFAAAETKFDKKVAVVGGGPSGLSAAYHLAKKGFDVTIYDMYEELGGMLRYGAPEYRAPKAVVAAEVARIVDLGIKVETGKKLGEDITVDGLKAEYDAVYLALGRQKNIELGVAGQELAMSALDFLHEPEGKAGENVLVIGGGSVAMDAACSALRTGAKKVTVVCLENRGEIPANGHDLRLALEEGIELVTKTGVEALENTADGKLAVTLKECVSVFDENHCFSPKYGEVKANKFVADTVIAAIGQGADTLCAGDVAVNARGLIVLESESCGKTNVAGVYAGGDVAWSKDAGSLAGAIVMGMHVAGAIAEELGYKAEEAKADRPKVDEIDQNQYNHYIDRNDGDEKDVDARVKCLSCEVSSGLNEETAAKETNRCLVCGTAVAKYIGPQDAREFNIACNNCHNCVDVCKEKAITFEYTILTRNSEFAFSK